MIKAFNKALFVFLVTVISLFNSVNPSYSENLTASGCSISNVGYLTDIAKEFEKDTGIRMFVRGGGSIVGLADVRSGNVDFAASCKSREPDDPDDVELIQVAWDALVFMVHKSNTVDNISPAEIKDIYEGKLTDWSQLKGKPETIVKVVVKPSKTFSGIEESLRKMFLDGKEIIKTPNSIIYTSAAIVEQAIETNPNAFGTSGFSSARKRDVKMLKINGIAPTKKNIASQLYPYKRPLFLAIPKKTKPAVKKFVDYVLGKKGQRLISSYGMVALKELK